MCNPPILLSVVILLFSNAVRSYQSSAVHMRSYYFYKTSDSIVKGRDINSIALRSRPNSNSFTEDLLSGDGTSQNSGKSVTVVAGATGYIGRAVVRESVRQGYTTIALVRDREYIESEEGRSRYQEAFRGAQVLQCNVTCMQSINNVFSSIHNQYDNVDTIVSCLASASGIKKEAYAIDYHATLNCLRAGQSQNINSKHFVLLSAFCVRRPLLQLQQAKLKFEAELAAQDDLTYTIVRPTAFFKSVSGQMENIQKGAPYVLFGDGAVTKCNPICERELAEFMIDSINVSCRHNQRFNIGGTDEPLNNKMLGNMMFKAIGMEPKYVYAPTWIFDTVITTLQLLATLLKSEALEDAAEVGRIGRYYAVEDMLTTDPKEKYGKITMQQHYNKIASMGQDPFTPIRATAYISQVLQVAPLAILCLPIGFSFAHPVDIVLTGNYEFSLLLASIGFGAH